MEVVFSIRKVPIRLTDERWCHIVENHNDLAGYADAILNAVEFPDFVLKGYGGSLIAVKKVDKRYLGLIYKETSKSDGFIITAHFSSDIKKEEVLWEKQR